MTNNKFAIVYFDRSESTVTMGICGLCNREFEEGDFERDYVNMNCAYFCEAGCGEVVLCLTLDDLKKLDERKDSFDSCIQKFTPSEQYVKAGRDDKEFYKVAIMQLKMVGEGHFREEHEGKEELVTDIFMDAYLKNETPKHSRRQPEGVYRLHDKANDGLDLYHDGCEVYYVAQCSNCDYVCCDSWGGC